MTTDFSEDEEVPGIFAGSSACSHNDCKFAMELSEDGEELPGMSSDSSQGSHGDCRSIGPPDNIRGEQMNDVELSSDPGVGPCDLELNDGESSVGESNTVFLCSM